MSYKIEKQITPHILIGFALSMQLREGTFNCNYCFKKASYCSGSIPTRLTVYKLKWHRSAKVYM